MIKIDSGDDFLFIVNIFSSTHHQIDAVFDGFDQLMRENRLDIIEDIFKIADPSMMLIETAIAFLSASLPIAAQIESRKSFYLKTWDILANLNQNPESALVGLKRTGLKITTCAG